MLYPKFSPLLLGIIFCIGGRGANGDPFSSVEFYSSFLDKWTKLSDMSSPRRHVGCISLKGKLNSLVNFIHFKKSSVLTWAELFIFIDYFFPNTKYI